MRPSLLAALSVLLATCSTAESEKPCGSGLGAEGGPGIVFDVLPEWALPGEEQVATFRFQTMTSCQDTLEGVAFRSDDGTQGTATVELDQESDTQPGIFMGGTIRFSAPAGGTFVLTGVVKPSATVVNRTVIVVVDRSAEPRAELPWACGQVATTAGGAVVCDDKVLRDGVEVQSLAAAPVLASAGRYLWVYSAPAGATDARLERLEDVGTGALAPAPLQPSNRAACCAPTQLLAGVPGEAFVLTEKVERFLAAPNSVTGGGAGAPPAGARYAVRASDGLVVVGDDGAGGGYACRFDVGSSALVLDPWLGAAAESFDGCQRLRGAPVGVDDGAVYVVGGEPPTLRLYKPQGAGMVIQASMHVPAGLTVVPAPAGLPVLSSGARWMLPRVKGVKLYLDAFDLAGALEYRGSYPGGAFAVTRAPPARTQLIAR